MDEAITQNFTMPEFWVLQYTYVAYCIVVIYMYLNVVLSFIYQTTNMH